MINSLISTFVREKEHVKYKMCNCFLLINSISIRKVLLVLLVYLLLKSIVVRKTERNIVRMNRHGVSRKSSCVVLPDRKCAQFV